MFLLLTTALAGTLIGWPCQRLNWGWRNVWSTCSIHSFAPAATAETPNILPTGFRQYTGATVPTNTLTNGGWYIPASGAIPKFFCDNAAATGTGLTSSLRNRCRRAVDAYGALVKSCSVAPHLAGNRGPNLAGPAGTEAPSSALAPHVSNVAGLTQNAQFCSLPVGTTGTPAVLATPSNTCPGLLGWFTVVYNACGFTNAPGLHPTQAPNTGNIPVYFPYGGYGVTQSVIPNGAVAPSTRVGFFCAGSAGAPDSWNQAGATFRTSRCRKALDQFGRTAARCHASSSTISGPAQAGGYSDPLRLLAIGASSGSPVSPNGFNVFAPACN